MKTEEIIERLRHPQKYISNQAKQAPATNTPGKQVVEKSAKIPGWIVPSVTLGILAIIGITWMFTLNAKNRADNLSETLSPQQVEGLRYDTDFNPNKDITYIQIMEGADRNVAVDTLGTTLPIISRFNYKAITPANYKIIGLAPWALTENFRANLEDPALIQHLLNRPEVGEAFITRRDVAPLLEDPQLLAALAQDNKTLDDFFNSDVIQKILANEQMERVVGASRFMSHLLISKAVKYYRDRPQEAIQLIEGSPTLQALRQNPGIRQAVQENRYLKPIAAQLLGAAQPTPATAAQTAPAESAAQK